MGVPLSHMADTSYASTISHPTRDAQMKRSLKNV